MVCCEKFTFDKMVRKLSMVKSQNIDSYLLSAIYYCLTGRKGTWVYLNKSSFVVVIKHPNISKSLIIFPEVCDSSDFSLTTEIIQEINNGENEIYLCRYTDLDFVKLNSQLTGNLVFKRIIEETLDWKYPLRILDTKIVSELAGRRFMKIRNMCVRAGKEVDIIPIEGKNQLNSMRSVLKLWEEKFVSTGKEIEDTFGFYNELFSLLEEEFEVSGLCFIKQGQPMGFTIWDVSCNNVANLFVNLSNPTTRGASDFQLVNTCRYLQKQGIQLLNTGGSETDSLDFFKNKYKPAISHEVFTYKLVN
ncbi:MAG: DUF2156 domain-containing protein [Oscillospiraceae bacterium]|jgi:hypothetical protein|nr:DUF2156 domain-containing protein [Oscillospiraceae bacterium]